jgi:tetratricopeptide (TPR) repeat protein
MGETYLSVGRSGEAIEHFETAARLSADTPSMNWKLGIARIVAGDPEGAIGDFQLEPDEIYVLQGMAMALHDLGRKDESAATMAALHARDMDSSWPFGFARAYAWVGKSDEAFRYLQMTAELDPGALDGAGTHPLLVKLHDDPRWPVFLRSINQAPEQLAEIAYNPRLPDEL